MPDREAGFTLTEPEGEVEPFRIAEAVAYLVKSDAYLAKTDPDLAKAEAPDRYQDRRGGFGAVGLLVSLLVLGTLTAIALVSLPGGGAPNVNLPTVTTQASDRHSTSAQSATTHARSPESTSTHTTTAPGTATKTTPTHAKEVGPVQPVAVPAAGNEMGSSAVVVCQADYSAVEAAVSYYRAENGTLPTSLALLKPWLRGSLASPYFTIAIEVGHPGVVEVGTRGHPLAPGEGNCSYAAY